MRRSIPQIKHQLQAAITRAEQTAAAFARAENPQLVETRLRNQERAETLRAVLYALEGDDAELSMLARPVL